MLRYALVVDDEPIITTLIATTLGQHDFEVETAASAQEARHILSEGLDPDIAIIDLHLGDGPSGIDLAHFLDTTTPAISILILTKYSAPDLVSFSNTDLPDSAYFLSKTDITDETVLIEAVERALAHDANAHEKDQLQGGPLTSLSRSRSGTHYN